jgi:hypothetical protein
MWPYIEPIEGTRSVPHGNIISKSQIPERDISLMSTETDLHLGCGEVEPTWSLDDE